MTLFGQVEWFGGYNKKKEKENDYGFIGTSDGNSYFVSKNALDEGTTLQAGDWVQFSLRERTKRNGDVKIDAQNVRVIVPDPELQFDDILRTGETKLIEKLLYQAIKQDNSINYACNWFQQWISFKSQEDEECTQLSFINTYRRYDTEFKKNLTEIIKDIQWSEYPSSWALYFLSYIEVFDRSLESETRIQYVTEWIEKQSPKFLLNNIMDIPDWMQKWEEFLQSLKSWLINEPISEQVKYSDSIPQHLKEEIDYWHLLNESEFTAVFTSYWNRNQDNVSLREQCLEKWLQCYKLIDFTDGWQEKIQGNHFNWILRRNKYGMHTPLNWTIHTVFKYSNSYSNFDSVHIKVPIKSIWKNVPPSFFQMLSTKVQKREVDLDIPIEAWALYLSNQKPSERSLNWLKKKWSRLYQAQKMTIFVLLGDKWFNAYHLHADLGGREALILWENMKAINLSERGLWWEQLDLSGKCSWYILAFQKGYKNEAFLEEDATHPLLQSFQLLYKHFMGIQSLNFAQWNSLLQDYCIELAANFDSEELKKNTWLWPACDYSKCNYCEGKLWRRKNESVEEIDRAYCPRTKSECSLAVKAEEKGARFKSYKILPHWIQWRMPEILQQVGITPSLGEKLKPEEYIIRFGGWLNRLLELQERLKCRGCQEPMKNDFMYSKEFTARYSMTIASCRHSLSEGHDRDIYFNDCWNRHECNQMIDSRDNTVREKRELVKDNYYLCIECGAAKGPQHYSGYKGWTKNGESAWDIACIETHFKKWHYVPGDKCPGCASENMERISKGNAYTHARCRDCSHQIRIPKVFVPVIELWEGYKQSNEKRGHTDYVAFTEGHVSK